MRDGNSLVGDGGGGGDDHDAAASGGGGGGTARARRAPVPRRTVGATPSLIEEEAAELREALSSSKHEKDVLRCEVHALQLELETMRELMSG
jgi:hypothetical protein